MALKIAASSGIGKHSTPEDRSHDPRERIHRHHFHSGELLGGFHDPDLGSDGRTGTTGKQQRRDHRPKFAHQRKRHQRTKGFRGTITLQRFVPLQAEHQPDEQPGDDDDDEREHAREVDLVQRELDAAEAQAGAASRYQAKKRVALAEAPDAVDAMCPTRRTPRSSSADHVRRSSPRSLRIAGRRIVERHRPIGTRRGRIDARRAHASRAHLFRCTFRDDASARTEVDVVHYLERSLDVMRHEYARRSQRVVSLRIRLAITPSEMGSRPVKGSSYMISIGSSAIARASATRRAIPPDSSAGFRSARASQPHRVELHQHQIADDRLRQSGVLAQRESHVLERRVIGEQRTELKQHAHRRRRRNNRAWPSLCTSSPATVILPRLGLS